MGNCKYPYCHEKAAKTWALVPLCDEHHEAIREETTLFYSKTQRYGVRVETESDRVHYNEISHMIPWSKEQLAIKKKAKAREKEGMK